jgi:RecB family exonuclease
LKSTICLWPASACLVGELVAELAAQERDELARTLVVLPTKRLGNWLIAMLADRLGAFVPPRIGNLDETLGRFAPPPPEAALRVVTPLEDKQLLAQLIEESGFRHLRAGHEHELVQLFAELVDWDLEEVAFERLTEAAHGGAKSEPALDTMLERMREIATLYALRRERLAAAEAVPASVLTRARYRTLARELRESGRFPGVDGAVYVVGMSSAKAMSAPLYHALARCPQVRLWVTAPAPSLRKGPIERLLDLCEAEPERRDGSGGGGKTHVIRAHAAESPLAEAALAVSLVEEAIASGCLPSHVALLVTDDHTYAAPLRHALRRAGLTANFAITAPLAQTRSGSWIAALVAALAASDDKSALLGLLTHPLTRGWLRRVVPAAAAMTDAVLDAALGYEACKRGGTLTPPLQATAASSREGAAASSSSDLHASCLAALSALLAPLLTAPRRPAAEHAKDWHAVLTEVGLLDAAAPREADEGVSQSVQAGLAEFFSTIEASHPGLLGSLTRHRFLAIIEEELLKSDVRSVGEQLAGVQVLSIEEARYVPFRVAVVVGCNEGRLPRALPKDRLVDNYLKTRAGLPGWQLLEAIEDTTFQLLAARLPQLRLTYAERDGRDELVRSRFIETLVAEGRASLAPAADGAAVRRLIDGEGLDADGPPPPPPAVPDGDEGRLAAPVGGLSAYMSRVSATSLEALLLCPYRYLLRQLGVEPLELPGDERAKDEGELLHAILEAFFTSRVDGIEPLPDGSDWQEFPARATRRLLALTEQLAPRGFSESSLFRHLRGFAWPAFAAHLHRLYDPASWRAMTSEPLRELRFGESAGIPVTIRLNGRDVALTGAVDAVDPGGSVTVVTDYKRKGSPDAKLARAGLAPQLALYAHALERAGLSLPNGDFRVATAVIGYWSIVQGVWTGIAAGSEVLAEAKSKGLVGARSETTLDEVVAQLVDHWEWRDGKIVDEDEAFRADPSACGFCRYEAVCRKDDPRWSQPMATRHSLKARLAVRETEDFDAAGV